MNKYTYKVVIIDYVSVREGSKVINEYGAKGWKLHTYTYATTNSGGFSKAFTGATVSNELHLVFEKEIKETEAKTPEEKYSEQIRQRKLEESSGSTKVARSPLVFTSDDPLY